MYRNKAGFTLIELLVVVAIIGILAVAAITTYTGVQLKAARSEAYTNLEMIRMLEEQVFADSACYEGLAGGVCPDPGNTYTCVFNDANNCIDPGEIAAPGMLPRFRPGPGRKYTYSIQVFNGFDNGKGLPAQVSVPYDGATPKLANPNTPCFIATATGAVGKVAVAHPGNKPDVFAIDCNNNRNF